MRQSAKAFFPGISRIQYEGPDSTNPLAFKHYNADEMVANKSMRDHLRFSVSYWHTIRGQLSDMFGVGTAIRPWEDGSNSMKMAETRVRVAFEFLEKLGAPFYAFHDRDVAPEGKTLRETNRNLDAIARLLKQEQQRTGVQLLWGTACLFAHPRYAHGAATSCNADVFAYAAAQVKKAIEVTHTARRRGLRLLGRARGLQHAAQHRPEARAGPPRQIPAHGRRRTRRPSASRASSTSSPSPRSLPSINTTPTPPPA